MKPRPHRVKWLLRTLLTAFVVISCTWWLLPRPPAGLHEVSYSRRVFDRNGALLRITLSTDDKYRIYTPLDQISPDLIAATLFLEDRHFQRHPGVNPVALFRSTFHFLMGRTGRGGASTLSMQLARVRFGLRTRTPGGKLVQIYRALQIERHYTKEQILEAYLNLAPYGGNIEGVGAASLLYFGKAASQLTSHEAIALSVIPQSPARRAPKPHVENPALTTASARLAARLRGVDVGFRPIAMERPASHAPHFTRQILKEQRDRQEITSTLDLPLQRTLERRIAEYAKWRHREGVHNAAALLVDTRDMHVLAQVGSADFGNKAIEGQVDGTRSRRSPGSALKPFVYAMAIDQGLIHPLTLLSDAPRAFGHYNPENYDRDFTGPIHAGDALARSRNIPAVTLAAQLKQPSFYDTLVHGGVALPRGRYFYGLALPLGGAEVTMEEMVRLYAALAIGGKLRPLIRHTDETPNYPSTRLFSPEATFLTLQMLGGSPRPGLNEPTITEAIHWKTGTSHGYRDAWSIAVFDHYVLAVWIGNFDGRSNPAFVGRTCAAPLLFSMIDSIRARNGSPPQPLHVPNGANLKQVMFCAVSGQVPTEHCTHRVHGWHVPGVSPIRTCDIHREILIDVQTGLRLARDDGKRDLKREVFEFWPDDLQRLFEKAGLPRRLAPPFLPDDSTAFSTDLLVRTGEAPQIVSPRGTLIVNRRLDTSAGEGVPLSARVSDGVGRLYWFANHAFLGSAPPRETLFWKPAPGVYQLTALDDHGRSVSRRITVATQQGR